MNSDLLKTFALEAEQCGDYHLARHYYKEVSNLAYYIFIRWTLDTVFVKFSNLCQ